MIRRPGVAIQEFAGGLICDRHFAPIDVQGLGIRPQGHPRGVAIAPNFVLLAVPVALGDFLHAAGLRQEFDLLI